MKQRIIFLLLRLVFAGFLIYGVYTETGIFTTIFAVLVFLYTELINIYK